MTWFVVRLAQNYLLVAAAFTLLLAAELAFPKGRIASKQAQLRAALFTAVFIPCSIAFGLLFSPQFNPLVPGLIGLAIAPFVADFFYYWIHRAQHAIPLLWRFHAVHHSVEELSVLGNYNHLSEIPLMAALYGLPLALLVPSPHAGLLGPLFYLHASYLHSPNGINFGRFASVISDNRTHRIHHSLEPRHFGKNYGLHTLIWDRLFGTAYFPATDEWPDVGLADQREPRTMLEYLSGRQRRAANVIAS